MTPRLGVLCDKRPDTHVEGQAVWFAEEKDLLIGALKSDNQEDEYAGCERYCPCEGLSLVQRRSYDVAGKAGKQAEDKALA